ncbi:hypothetical protein Y032_0246g35 [Ancylostoma ceylanicum]|uniref:Endonuclease/exonuclease/phosphatase domain-containing protein n=1 Tax=Ancylostoma ceylanicum TaxID=53326 RepID=A0A016SDR6_9BILA|nr:hypothetical protein Y032_0246g35 [Ancylostoma ceylanicum]
MRELLRYGISIAVLQELRITGTRCARVTSPDSDDWMMLYYSEGEHHIEGVRFALDRRTYSSVVAFQPITSRMAVPTLEGTITAHIVVVYAPTEDAADTSKDRFYSQLHLVVDSLPHSELITITADINAHVESHREGW